MRSPYEGRRILITGGTRSFEHSVARKHLGRKVAEVRILSRDGAKQDLMRHELCDSRIRSYIGDVRDYGSIERAMRDTDYVFHAAAFKQASCELFPMEAVKANVVGSGGTSVSHSSNRLAHA